MAVAALVAAVIGRTFVRLSGSAASVATLGLMVVVFTVLSNADWLTRGARAFSGIPPYASTGWCFAAAAFSIVVARLFRDSDIGLGLRSSRDDIIAAEASGVDVQRARYVVWVVSAALAAVSGALYAHFVLAILPQAFHFEMTFLIVTMVIVGGQSITGAVVGTAVVAVLAELLRRAENGVSIGGIHLSEAAGLTSIILALTIIAILTFRPQGIFGHWEVDELLARATARKKVRGAGALGDTDTTTTKREQGGRHMRLSHGFRFRILLAGLVGAMSTAAHAELKAGTVYKIGWASDLTNYLSFVDAPLAQGVQVAIDEINAKGGIAGKVKIELDRRDMKSDPMLGATVVQELIADGANFIVTTCDTDVSLPGAQIAAAAHLPVMSSCGADAAGPGQVPDGFGFLNVPGTLTQGAMLAEYAAKKGYKKAYTLKSKSEGYTQTLAAAFEERFKELGGEIVGADFYTLGDASYRVTATKMVNSDADVIMTNTFVPDTTAFLKDLERLGNKKPLLLVDGNDAPVVFDAGDQLSLAVMATYGGNRTPGSAFDLFEQEFKAKYGGEPESLQTALGYDLVVTVAAAVEAAGTVDGTAVRDAINNLENVPGATGMITFKNSPIGLGIPKKDYSMVTFDVPAKKFVVESVGFPEKFPAVK